MSVRRRNVQNRIGAELQRERGLNEMTCGLLKVQSDLARRCLEERDTARLERDQSYARIRDILAELGQHFATDPPRPLSRKDELFRLLREAAPWAIPSLPPTHDEVLRAVLDVTAVAELAEFVADIRGTAP